ncbi:hypothetical protein OPQ81_002414 [Rhizoctonia solani]|nr:hypothetical protein OPQ81_002414 [Rhizoctonia solani]
MSPSLPSHDTRRRDALSIDSLVDRPSTRQCGKCQEAQTRCDGREPCRNCEVRGTLCGYAWSSFSAPHTLPPLQQAPAQHYPAQFGAPPAKRRSPVPTGSIFPRSSALDGGWAIVPQGTNAPTAHPPGPVVSCKTCQARNTQCDGVTPVCGSCRMRRLECYLATPASTNNMRNGTATMTWSARDRQALNPRSFPPSLSQAAMLAPPSRPRAPSDASKPSSSRSSLSFMLNPKPEGKVASGSKENAQRPTELKVTPTHHVTTPTHHVTPPTPVAPVSMEKAQAMDVDPPVRDPPASPSSSTGGATLSRRPSRKRSASPESHYGREDSPSRESVSSLGLSALGMSERRNRALSHIHSPRSSIESHARRQALEPHSPRGSTDFDPRNSIDSHVRSSMDHSRSHSARGSIDSHSHSPTRSARNSIDSHPFSSRGQPLDEAHSTRVFNHSVDSLSNSHRSMDPPSRPVDYPNRPADPHSDLPVDPHPADAHTRRSIHPQGLASPSDPNRPRSRSKSSLSHLLDGGGYGGMTSSAQVSPTHTVPASPVQSKSPVYTMGSSTSPIHTQASLTRATDNKSPIHTTHPPNHGRPPRTPVSELGPGPSPTATHGPGPSPKSSGPGHSPKAHGPGPSPTSAYGPARSPTATSTSEPFSRPMSADSSIRPVSADSFSRPQSVHREANPGVHRDSIPPAHPHPPKQTSISTALADMQLKSAGTSRASSPGGHIHGYTRDVFVHSAFNGANTRHYPNWTFGTVGENMADGRKPGMANVWRHETEAGMRRREAEAELRKQDQVELQRRRSEGGAKRRKLGEAEAEDPERERDREAHVGRS